MANPYAKLHVLLDDTTADVISADQGLSQEGDRDWGICQVTFKAGADGSVFLLGKLERDQPFATILSVASTDPEVVNGVFADKVTIFPFMAAQVAGQTAGAIRVTLKT